MRVGILGAGLSGVSLAYMLQNCRRVTSIDLLEKAPTPGGLCRSFRFGKIHCDIGPHIIFSKDSEVLSLILDVLGENVRMLRRSNKIFHNGRFVKYPFENDLGALSQEERDHCLSTYLDNPYRGYVPQNMLQFFLATFGQGMTDLYLQPYNEKIWKFDPAFMDTQMVERVPKPPSDDIIKSAQGIPTEGYLHQLFFYYPRTGGIESFVDGFVRRLTPKVAIHLSSPVVRVEKRTSCWRVRTGDGLARDYDYLVSTIPVQELLKALGTVVPWQVRDASTKLKFNSIAVCALNVKRDHLGHNFAVMVADREVLFHRLTKINFLYPDQQNGCATTLMAEVTYRRGDFISRMSDGEIVSRVAADLEHLGLIDHRGGVMDHTTARFEYAYVICDLEHRRNVRIIHDYCQGELGLCLHGRFGEFEYLNMDAVIRRSIRKCRELDHLFGLGRCPSVRQVT